jgi:hypothetical protein
MEIVGLTLNEDEVLFTVASGLANIADKIDSGEEIEELAAILRAAGSLMALVMCAAHDRANVRDPFEDHLN